MHFGRQDLSGIKGLSGHINAIVQVKHRRTTEGQNCISQYERDKEIMDPRIMTPYVNILEKCIALMKQECCLTVCIG